MTRRPQHGVSRSVEQKPEEDLGLAALAVVYPLGRELGPEATSVGNNRQKKELPEFGWPSATAHDSAQRMVRFTCHLPCARPRLRRRLGAVCLSPHGWCLRGLEQKRGFLPSAWTAEVGRAELKAPPDTQAQGVLCPSGTAALPTPSLVRQVPGYGRRSPLSGLEAVSEPSKEPQWGRMSMCFLNQKGGLSLAEAAQANKQKAVN